MEQEKVINIKISQELHKRLRIGAAIEEKTLREYIIEIFEQHVKNQGGVSFTEPKETPKKGKK